MSQADCAQKAENCEQRAAQCADTPLRAHWLAMATEWRDLAGDKTDQATLARLMAGRRTVS